MSLDFKVDKIKGYEEMCWTEVDGRRELAPVTKALVFHTLSIGMGEITEDNAVEFFSRIQLIETLYDSTLHSYDEETEKWSRRPITREDVDAHVGLWTNVFPEQARPTWLNRVFETKYRGVPHISMPGDWDYEGEGADDDDEYDY